MSATDQPLGGASPLGGSAFGIDASTPAYVAMFLANDAQTAEIWTVPVSGWWRFVQWGPGIISTGGNPGGGSGAYAETVVALAAGQHVSIRPGAAGNPTLVSLPNGRVVSAGSGTVPTGGVASGGDYMLGGSDGGAGPGIPGAAGLGTGGGLGGPGSSAGGGAGAPGRLPYRGGSGANGSGSLHFPGGGGGSGAIVPGDGFVLAVLQPTSKV